jgi:hypothetical protein
MKRWLRGEFASKDQHPPRFQPSEPFFVVERIGKRTVTLKRTTIRWEHVFKPVTQQNHNPILAIKFLHFNYSILLNSPGNRPILARYWASTAFTGADNVGKNQKGYRTPVLAQKWANIGQYCSWKILSLIRHIGPILGQYWPIMYCIMGCCLK